MKVKIPKIPKIPWNKLKRNKPLKTPPPSPVPVSVLSGYQYQDQWFWDGVKKSALTHVGLFIVAFLMWFVFPSEPLVLTPSIRVDIVDMPDIKKADLAKVNPADFTKIDKEIEEADKKAQQEEAEKKAAAEKEIEDKNAMALKKKKQKAAARKKKKIQLKSAIERIKALQKIEEQVNKSENEQKVQAKGNLLSKGTELIGQHADTEATYGDKMRRKLRENWNLPVWLSRQNLSAQVMIYLDTQGDVINLIFKKSSGNEQYDEMVKRTIMESKPFGPPPSEILTSGVTLGFPL